MTGVGATIFILNLVVLFLNILSVRMLATASRRRMKKLTQDLIEQKTQLCDLLRGNIEYRDFLLSSPMAFQDVATKRPKRGRYHDP